MTDKQAIRILGPLIVAFPNSKADEGTTKIYARALMYLTETELSASVMKCMRTCNYLPSIAEIIEQADNMVQVASGIKHKSNDEAWNEMCSQRNKCWPHKKPVFSTKEIEQTVSSMGWVSLCVAEEKDLGTTRAQFLKMYESICKRKKEAKIDGQVIDVVGQLGVQIKTIK